MARMSNYDIVLLSVTTVFVVLDIILALCLKFILPMHVTRRDHYYANQARLNFEQAAEYCPCLHAIFPRGTKKKIIFDKILVPRFYKRSVDDRITTISEKYPYLVSLSIPAYSDDTEQKIFACNGLVQSAEWVLTATNCVQEESEWYQLTVRSGSIFWSTLGQEHSVTDVVKLVDNNLVLLKVLPTFSEQVLPFLPINYPFEGNWTYAVSLGWDDQMYKKKLSFRHKYKTFDVEEWISKTSDLEQSKVCYNSSDCQEIHSKPLLTSCHQLVGLKCADKVFYNRFSGLRSNNTNGKDACYSIYGDNRIYKDAEVCQL